MTKPCDLEPAGVLDPHGGPSPRTARGTLMAVAARAALVDERLRAW